MSRKITISAVDRFVNSLNDKRFSARLFGSFIVDEDNETNQLFLEIIESYLFYQNIRYDRGDRDFVAIRCHDLYGSGI
jgi:hypothetical protein